MTTFYQYMKDTYTPEELREITLHGCVSGCAGTLIYYRDTCALYDLHSDELHDQLRDWMDCVGETPEFITDQLGFADGFKNAMVWFVAEQYANDIIQTAEAEEEIAE
jgi:hypothetical protein